MSIGNGENMPVDLTDELRKRVENTLRFLAVDAVNEANSGHPGAPMGMTPMALELWNHHLRFDPADPQWPLRDRFVLSSGHASMLLYGLAHLFGYPVSIEDLRNFRQLGSLTPGHPEYGHTPGVEVTTGPLGAGFANGVGMAIAAQMTRARFAREVSGSIKGPGQHFVYGIVSDGDLMEGISAEAGSIAGHLGLGNLIYLYDDNHITIDGPTSIAFSESISGRFEAQAWHVQKVDGQNGVQVGAALRAARAEISRPSLIICRTVIGYGSPHKAGTSGVHGAPLGEEETRLTKLALNWPPDAKFLVPDDVRDYLNQRINSKRVERVKLDDELFAWQRAYPDLAESLRVHREKELPADFAEQLTEGMDERESATRIHSGVVINRLAAMAPFLVGGSADLAASNNTRIKDGGDVGPAAGDGGDPFAGCNLHFGIREHAMGGIVNGIALDGTFLPFGATFLVFSDYARPALRLAALMGARSTFVFTHDSIFVGEDGPTHQPIEHLDCLRLIPGLTVFRPADGVETAMAWAWVAKAATGPVALALTRQTLPKLARRPEFLLEDIWRGAYVLEAPEGDASLTLLATGSEVSLALGVARRLREQGTPARVVSMPSAELFVAQPKSYRQSVIPGGSHPVIAVEAGIGESLRRFTGSHGLVFGIGRFGASAPAADVAQFLGFTEDHLLETVRDHLKRQA